MLIAHVKPIEETIHKCRNVVVENVNLDVYPRPLTR